MLIKRTLRVVSAAVLAATGGYVFGTRASTGEFTPAPYNADVAEFHGAIKTEWIRGDDPQAARQFKLLEPVEYVASNNTVWRAGAGAIIDGASIPRAFWTVVGAPTTGPYRDASVIHDVYCESRERHWEETHWAFYDACREAGLGPWKANLMYLAVFHYGPKWDERGNLQRDTQDLDEASAERMRDFCKANPGLTLPELNRLDPRIWERGLLRGGV